LVDGLQNRNGAFALQQRRKFRIPTGNPDEANCGGACLSRVIHGVADVEQLAPGQQIPYAQNAVRRGLGLFDVVGGDDRVERDAAGVT